ncbi:MAG: hypothetical protein LBI14_11365 [Treponema sp.]|jgi:hypothetical protein|nr:hypothetical protein [Treponema sp.]
MNIGVLKESSLHKYLKFQYSGADGKTEIPVGDYVCDGQTVDGELIEIQTGSFGPLKEKIKNLSQKNKVRIIYPIIKCKYIEVYDADGKYLRKRKSRLKGSSWDLFNALLYAPELAQTPGVIIELAFIDIVEKRKEDGNGPWRRKFISIGDKIPYAPINSSAGYESIVLSELNDYYRFLPFTPKQDFTVSDLAKTAGISVTLARKCLYVLNKLGLIERIGKKGNSYVYKLGYRV